MRLVTEIDLCREPTSSLQKVYPEKKTGIIDRFHLTNNMFCLSTKERFFRPSEKIRDTFTSSKTIDLNKRNDPSRFILQEVL